MINAAAGLLSKKGYKLIVSKAIRSRRHNLNIQNKMMTNTNLERHKRHEARKLNDLLLYYN